MIAARVLGYGHDYTFEYNGEETTINLAKLENVKVDEKSWNRDNSFKFTFPNSKTEITFKLLTHGDEQKINEEVRSLKKIRKDADATISTRLKYMITSVGGDSEQKTIRNFVDNYL